MRCCSRVPPAYAELGFGAGAFPLTEAIHREVLSLPMGPHLTQPRLDESGRQRSERSPKFIGGFCPFAVSPNRDS